VNSIILVGRRDRMKYYCIGIKGSGMATLACLLKDLGNDVSGYDDVRDFKFTEVGLKERNIPVFYDTTHALDEDTIVTYSKAFKDDHPEIQRVKKLGLKIQEYNEVVADITKMFRTISVCGTHGKTTTTTMVHTILDKAFGCNCFIGDGTGIANPENTLFAIESDEFNRHFLKYFPSIAVVTNIELEHTECYRDIEDIVQTFDTFVQRAKEFAVLCGDNSNVRKLHVDIPKIYYGFEENNDAVIKNLVLDSSGSKFDLFVNGEFYHTFELPLYGKHMVLDAVASILVCRYLGVDATVIHDELKTFQNAKRRFAIEVASNTVIIDDYAHHPTEIRVTLEAVRQKYPDKKLAVVFKPNTYSRTKDFYQDFADSLNIADKCFLTEIDCNREKQEEYPGVSSKLIFDLLKNGEMIADDSVSKLLEFENEVVCFMSCANIEHMRKNFIDTLQKNM